MSRQFPTLLFDCRFLGSVMSIPLYETSVCMANATPAIVGVEPSAYVVVVGPEGEIMLAARERLIIDDVLISPLKGIS